MAHFMNYSKHIFETVGVVKEYIWHTVIGAKAVCTAGLSLVFINIYPAFTDTFSDLSDVFFPKRSKAFSHDVDGLFKRYDFFGSVYQRDINIVHLELVNTQHLFTQFHVAVDYRKVFTDFADEIVVYADRDVSSVQCGFKGGTVFSYPGRDNIGLGVVVVVG